MSIAGLAGMIGGFGGGLGQTAELAVVLRLKDQMSGPLSGAERSLDRFAAHSTGVSGGLTKIGAGAAHAAVSLAKFGLLAGAGIAAVAIDTAKAAGQFQADMELIRTQAGSTQTEVDAMTKAVIALAPSVGMGPDALAKGLYHVESAGLRGAKALDVLRAAAQGAQTGQANLEDVTNALVAAVYSGIKGTTDMTAAMGQLDAIVGSGNMRMEDLAVSLSSGILPAGRAFGLALKDVGAALATLTDQGVPAQEAATRLRMSFSLLGAPTNKAAKELSGIGMTELQLAKDMRKPDGLLVALQDLYAHLKKNGDILSTGELSAQGTDIISKAFGGGRSSATILTLLQSLDKLSAKYDIIGQGAKNFGDKWQATTQTAAYNAKAFGANLDDLKVIMGTELLPVATTVLKTINDYLSSPSAQQGAKNLGDAIAGMFTKDNIDKGVAIAHDVFGYLKNLPWDAIKSGIEGAAQGAKSVVDIFKSLPPGVQEGLITLLAANKLSGGLIASGIGDLLKVTLGSLKNIYAGNVTVISATGGGLPGTGTPGGGGIPAIIPIAVAAAAAYLDVQATNDAKNSVDNGTVDLTKNPGYGPRTASQVAYVVERIHQAFRAGEREALSSVNPFADSQRNQIFRQGERSPQGGTVGSTLLLQLRATLATNEIAKQEYMLRQAQIHGDDASAKAIQTKLDAENKYSQAIYNANTMDSVGRHAEAQKALATAQKIADKAGLTASETRTLRQDVNHKNWSPKITVPITINTQTTIAGTAVSDAMTRYLAYHQSIIQ